MKKVFLIAYFIAALGGGVSQAMAGSHDERSVGAAVYARSCIACHAIDGVGAMPGIPDLTDKKGALSKSDGVLLKGIINGINSGSSPIPMPAKGGDENLTEAEARLVLDYIRRKFGN
ncbi:MAG: c-type cytochrome [Rhodospirillales bacterium]|nr:c-type cytochrome [Rhodospirillales bacterium]